MARPRPLLLPLLFCASLAVPACGGAQSVARTSMESGGMAYGGAAPAAASEAASAAPAADHGYAATTTGSIRTASATAPSASRRAEGPTPVSARAAHGAAVARPGVGSGGAASAQASEPQSPAPMLIYTAQLALAVDAVPAAIDRAIEFAIAAGGHLAARTDTTVQVRVPSARFRAVLAQYEGLGTVQHREVQAEDVSEQFHDLEVQLTNLRAVRARLQEFLARATNITEMLSIERELERVGGQIDQIEGRMRFLANRAAFSTITLALSPTPRAVAAPTPAPPPPPDVVLPFNWLHQLGLPTLLQLR